MRTPLLLLFLAGHSLAAADSFEALLARATSLEDAERFEDAVKDLRAALALRPGDEQALMQLGADEERLGGFEDAAGAYGAVLAEKPDDYQARVALGQVDVRLGRFKEASRQFQRARNADPGQPDAYIAEGYARLDVGDFGGAEKTFRDLLAIDTTSFDSYHHMASLMERSGREAEAEVFVRKALGILEARGGRPLRDYLHSLGWLAKILLEQGRYEEAEPLCRKGLERSRLTPLTTLVYRPAFQACLGEVAESRGRFDQAEAIFKSELSQDCGSADLCADVHLRAWVRLGRLYARQGKWAQAKAAADQADAIPLRPLEAFLTSHYGNEGDMFEALARLFQSLGEQDRARRLCLRLFASKALPDSSPVRARLKALLSRPAAASAPGIGEPSTD